MRKIISSDRYVKFYRFWSWEYTFRNSDFQKLCAKAQKSADRLGEVAPPGTVDMDLPPEKRKVAHKLFDELEDARMEVCRAFGYFPENQTLKRYTPSEMIEELVKYEEMSAQGLLGDDQWQGDALVHPASSRATYGGVKYIRHRELEDGKRVLSVDDGRMEGYDMLVAVDFDTPPDAMAKELELLRGILSTFEAAERGESQDFRQEDEWLIERLQIQSRPKASFDYTTYTARALGLWLWDEVYGGLNGGKPKRGAIIQAIRRLRKDFNLGALQYEFSETEVFRKLLAKTTDCITEAEVLGLR